MYEWEWTHSDVARFYVARNRDGAGAVVAYCAGWIIFDELHVNNLAVDPSWRRRGVAGALLTFVLQEAAAENAVRATLEVRRSNEAARRLYERFGFACAGVRTAYYREPVEDALVLWRNREGTSGQTGNPETEPAC
jgi:[ribosomal protein S18]-alanine N-acetyltransferase